MKTLEFNAKTTKIYSDFLSMSNLSCAEAVIGCPQDGASTTEIFVFKIKILMQKLWMASQLIGTLVAHIFKFWHKISPHKRNPTAHFLHKTNNPSENQNSSKWLYFVLNPCTVLVHSLWVRGNMHHYNHPVSCRDSVRSSTSTWAFVEKYTAQKNK